MGVIEELLADFELPDESTACRIEINDKGRVDLHMDQFQLTFTEDEYEEFAEVIVKARDELKQKKDL